jgi:hypothetical protein
MKQKGALMEDLLLLSKDVSVAEIVGGELRPLLLERLPLALRRTGDVRAWLESRAIDGHRTNSRLLKRALRLEHKDDLTAVLAVNAATITDNYWVKPLVDEATRYEDVRFKVNLFDNLALTGNVNSFDQPPSRTPELTNTGSFEKCWRFEDGGWLMYKAGKPEELFSELLAFRLGRLLGFPMAEYEAADGFIKSRDFTKNAAVDFEPAAGIIGDESDYIKIYKALLPFGDGIAEQYVRMCYLDGLIYNMDRHENNFGVLRDSDTGAVLSLAPFYDHNIALIARGYPNRAPGDRLIGDFAELVLHIGKPFTVRKLTEQEIRNEATAISFDPPMADTVPNPREFTARYLVARQDALVDQCGGLLLHTVHD